MAGYGRSYTHAAAVTPHNSNLLSAVSAALYVGGAGDLTVDTEGGETSVLIPAVPAGTIIPLAVRRVRATGTTATNIVALWQD